MPLPLIEGSANQDRDDSTNKMLVELHEGYRAKKKLLLHQLEGTFYPKKVLSDLTSPFVGCYIGTGRNGWRTITTFQNSYMDLRVIEENGLFLLGNNVPIYQPSEAEIRTEQKADLKNLIRTTQSGNNAGIGLCYSIVHWCGRTIFYLANGQVTSKSEACRWCRKNVKRDEFDELFKIAENRRYPYGGEKVTERIKTMCKELLIYVNALISDNQEKIEMKREI